MWTYHQSTGLIEHDGVAIDYGFSGFEDAINVPGMDEIPMIGPLPKGKWKIVGPPFDDAKMGKYVLRLMPAPGNLTNRNGFCWHNYAPSRPFESSEGCLCSTQLVRRMAWDSGDYDLECVA